MVNNEIKIILKGDLRVDISVSNPSFNSLIENVISNPDICVDEISVETNIENFDKDIFLETIKETIKDIKEKLKIDEDKYKEAISKIPGSTKDK